MLVKLLQEHILGKRELKPTQIDAAKFLLSYAMPKPAEAQELTGELTIRWKS